MVAGFNSQSTPGSDGFNGAQLITHASETTIDQRKSIIWPREIQASNRQYHIMSYSHALCTSCDKSDVLDEVLRLFYR